MSDEKLVEWLGRLTDGFELHADQDDLFAEILGGFGPADGQHAGVIGFALLFTTPAYWRCSAATSG